MPGAPSSVRTLLVAMPFVSSETLLLIVFLLLLVRHLLLEAMHLLLVANLVTLRCTSTCCSHRPSKGGRAKPDARRLGVTNGDRPWGDIERLTRANTTVPMGGFTMEKHNISIYPS